MKARRQARILDIIRNQIIETQEELAASLAAGGMRVTQATVSRDIKELRLNKVPTGDGRYRYAAPEEPGAGSWDKRRRIFQESVLGVEYSDNIVVIRTLQGTAASVAYAIDHQAWSEVVGSVAGEDTVLVVVRPAAAGPVVAERVRELTH